MATYDPERIAAIAALLQSEERAAEYGTLIADGRCRDLLDAINAPIAGQTIPRSRVSGPALFEAIPFGVVAALDPDRQRAFAFLTSREIISLNVGVLTWLQETFPSGEGAAALAAAITAAPSAIEQLFGHGVVLDELELVAALRTFDFEHYPAPLLAPDAEGRELKVRVGEELVAATMDHGKGEHELFAVIPEERDDAGKVTKEAEVVRSAPRADLLAAMEVQLGRR